MPIRKYRSVEDMPPPPPAESGRADLVARIRALWNRSVLLSPPCFSKGVTRFRSIEEANAKRVIDTVERMRRSAR